MKVVSKISLPDTFRQLKVGESVTLNAAETAPFNSARSAVYRLNASNEGKFEITTVDNGCNYTVRRNN